MRAQTKKAKKQKNRNKEKALTIPREAFQSKSADNAEAEEAMIIDQETDWLRRQENQSRKRKHEGTIDTKAVEEKAKKLPSSSSSSSNSPPFETSSAVTRRDESDTDHGVLSFHKKHFNIQKSKSQSTDRKSINREAAEGRLSEYEEEELAKMLEAVEILLSMGKK